MTPTRARRRPLIVAHRGFHRRARENTRQAIVAAKDVGADGVEFDVRTTADGVQVLHHNRTRLLGGRQRPIALLERGDLPSWIPTLDSIVRRMRAWTRFLVDVEIKEETLRREIVELLRTMPKGRLVVTSFHLPVCRAAATQLPGARVGWLREGPHVADVLRAKRGGCGILIVHRRGLRPDIARAAKRHGIELWAWGINTARRARAAAAIGATALITDRPDVLLRADLRPPAQPRTSARKGRPGN